MNHSKGFLLYVRNSFNRLKNEMVKTIVGIPIRSRRSCAAPSLLVTIMVPGFEFTFHLGEPVHDLGWIEAQDSLSLARFNLSAPKLAALHPR